VERRCLLFLCRLTIDVFLSKYHMNNLASPKRLSASSEFGSYDSTGSSDDGRDDEFVDVHEIHLEDDDTGHFWLELELE
jgi:hypothetical protein